MPKPSIADALVLAVPLPPSLYRVALTCPSATHVKRRTLDDGWSTATPEKSGSMGRAVGIAHGWKTVMPTFMRGPSPPRKTGFEQYCSGYDDRPGGIPEAIRLRRDDQHRHAVGSNSSPSLLGGTRSNRKLIDKCREPWSRVSYLPEYSELKSPGLGRNPPFAISSTMSARDQVWTSNARA